MIFLGDFSTCVQCVSLMEDLLLHFLDRPEFFMVEGNNLCDVFQVNHEGHAYGHRETTSNGRTEGQYQVVLPDGRVQTVKYFADNSGFHPQIIYTQ